MKHYIALFLACLFRLSLADAQTLTTEQEVCPAQLVPFQTPTPPFPETAQYNWDFCTGDLLQTPQVSLVSPTIDAENIATGTGIQQPEGIEIVRDGQKWYGFIPGWGSAIKSLVRAEFGESLDEVPTYYSLGNIGGLLPSAFHLKIVKVNGKWYAFVSNILNGSLVRIDFGTNLANNNPTATMLNIPAIVYPQAVDVQRENGKYYLLITSGGGTTSSFVTRFSAFELGTDIENLTPTQTTHTNFSPYASEFWTDMALLREGDNWVGLIGGASGASKQLLGRLSFGASLLNTPTYTSLNSALPSGIAQIRGVGMFLDGKNYMAMCISNLGDFMRVNFGDSFSNTPQVTNLGKFGLLGSAVNTAFASLCLKVVYHDSEYTAFTINRRTEINAVNQLIKLKFPNLCNSVPSTATTANTASAFYQAGVQHVNLGVSDANGFPLLSYKDDILVKEAMISNFNFDGQCLGSPTQFINLSRGQTSQLAGWEWSFGDGQTSTAYEPAHTYTQAGVYTVKLKVNNLSSCTNELTQQVRVSSRPTANFKVKSADCATRTVEFEDLSDLNALDKSLGGEIVSRVWIFGDGTRWIASPYTATSYTKTFATNDVFTVTLAVTDNVGCTSSVTKNISLQVGSAPFIDFSHTTACTDVPTKFIDLSTLPAGITGEVTGWAWTFYQPDGVTVLATSASQNPTYTYTATGDYPVRLWARNSLGCAQESTHIVRVLASPNSLYSVSKLTGSAPLTIQFTNQTSSASAFLWDFGTGEISTAASPSYTFKQNGVYTVTFQAKNANGCGKIVNFLVVVEQTTAVEPSTALPDFLKIYPNPVEKNLRVDIAQIPRLELTLTNLAGKTCLKRSLDMGQNTLDISALPAGVYVAYLRTAEKMWVLKIVKI